VSDRVFVTGGTGFIGGALVDGLISDGREVTGLARSEAGARALRSKGASVVLGDVLDPISLAAGMDGAEVVYHVAGVFAMCRHDPRPMYRTNVEGSGNVIRVAARTGVRRVVYTSSAAAIGEERGAIGREDSTHRGSYISNYERSKHLAERRVLERAEALDIDVVSVNPSSVQGPGRTGGTARLLIEAARGRLPVAVDTWLSLVDIADCTQGHLLAERHGIRGQRYLISGATLSTRDALDLLDRLTGIRHRVRFLPARLAIGAGGVVGVAARVLRRDPPVCREMVRTLVHGHRFDGSRATRQLGLEYMPVEETVRRTLTWFAERGLVPPLPTAPREPSAGS
jgi:dihydroflavonol-4-reductase